MRADGQRVFVYFNKTAGDDKRGEPYSNTDETSKTTTDNGAGSSDAAQGELSEQGRLRSRDGGMVEGRGGQSEIAGGNEESPKSRAVDSRGRDERLVAEFGEDWKEGWNGLGLPNQKITSSSVEQFQHAPVALYRARVICLLPNNRAVHSIFDLQQDWFRLLLF